MEWWSPLVAPFEGGWQALKTLIVWDWSTLGWLGVGLLLVLLGRTVGAYGKRLPEFLPRPAAVTALGTALGLAGAAGLAVPLVQLPGMAWVLGVALAGAILAGVVSLFLLGRGLFALDVLPMARALSAEKRDLLRQSGDCGARLERAERAERGLELRNEELTWEISRLQQALAERDQALQGQRLRDDRTGLFNPAHFVERLQEEFERGQRSGNLPQPLFIGVQGLDGLDESVREWVLGQTGKIIKATLRLEDLAAHYAEREFLVVATDASADGMVPLARRLHRALKRGLRKGPDGQALGLHFAFVVVDLGVEFREFADFLEICNQVLLQVRHQPADRLVRVSGGAPSPTAVAGHP
jgi:diguanylate cyclase (GGDEF)-like protein